MCSVYLYLDLYNVFNIAYFVIRNFPVFTFAIFLYFLLLIFLSIFLLHFCLSACLFYYMYNLFKWAFFLTSFVYFCDCYNWLSRNPEVHYRPHIISPIVPIFRNMCPISRISTNLPEIHFNIILLSTSRPQ